MKLHSARTLLTLAASALLIAGAFFGCSRTAQNIRKFTYPPGFHYIERSEVQGTMRNLARDVHALNRILGEKTELSTEEHDEVVRLLASIETTAARVDPHGQTTNQPLLQRNIEAFRRDLARARQAAEADPPNYFLAGTTVGSCLYCHKEGPGK